MTVPSLVVHEVTSQIFCFQQKFRQLTAVVFTGGEEGSSQPPKCLVKSKSLASDTGNHIDILAQYLYPIFLSLLPECSKLSVDSINSITLSELML